MADYKGKTIFETDLTLGNQYRKEYLNSIERFVENKYKEGEKNRDKLFGENLAGNQSKHREDFLKMIGQPVSVYPETVPVAEYQKAGSDDMCDIEYVRIETMPGFWFFGIFMKPHGYSKTPLVVAQHGGGSTPEICSEMLGVSNYSCFTKRALERGFSVFAPQLLIWNFETNTDNNIASTGIEYNRIKINDCLRQFGLTITGLEVFCIRRSIDYFASLDCIDSSRIGMMGLSYGGYFSLHTAAVDTRIKSIYAGAIFTDRSKICFSDWAYQNAANTFFDAEVCMLCAPRRMQIDIGKTDEVFDYSHSEKESERVKRYYSMFGADNEYRFNLWDGGHRFDSNGKGFEFFFDAI